MTYSLIRFNIIVRFPYGYKRRLSKNSSLDFYVHIVDTNPVPGSEVSTFKDMYSLQLQSTRGSVFVCCSGYETAIAFLRAFLWREWMSDGHWEHSLPNVSLAALCALRSPCLSIGYIFFPFLCKLNRSTGKALRGPGVWGCKIWRHSVHEGVKVVGPKHRLSLLPRIYSWSSFLLETASTSGP
jgi:hypothetical protein